MKQIAAIFIFILSPSLSFAIAEKDFKWCVQLKDLSIAVAKQADEGVKRDVVKIKLGDPRVFDLVDFVYDFHGVKTNQMENCVKHFDKKTKKK